MNTRQESHDASKAREIAEEEYYATHPHERRMRKIRNLDTDMKLMLMDLFNRSPF